MAAGFRSPLPLLGLGSGSAPQGGVRSLLAPWVGGAGVAPDATPGVRGLMAFWAGGAGLERAGGGGKPHPQHPPHPRHPRGHGRNEGVEIIRPQRPEVESISTQPAPPHRETPRQSLPADTQPAQMLHAELAQMQRDARTREARFAAERERMSAQAEAAEASALLAARKRDNNRRAQILIALLMLD